MKNVCQWPTFLEKCLSMTNIYWNLSVSDQHFCCKCWSMRLIFAEMKDHHNLHFFTPLWIFFLECVVVSLICVLTGRAVPCNAISRRIFSLKRLTNISWKMSVNDQQFLKNVCQWPTVIAICLSMTNIFAANVGQWDSFLQKWRTTIICTVSRRYECFSWKVWLFHWFCVLTGWALPCSAISRELISLTSLTNVSWKISVNDQHFLKNVCQWP